MAIGKPRGKKGMRPVFCYDPRTKTKKYVGSRQALRGKGGAQELEREKRAEFAKAPITEAMTCDDYAARWLTAKHGEGTRRPSPTTKQVNRGYLKLFRAEFGTRALNGGINRVEALDWAKAHPYNAKAVSAMFNDAVDDMLTDANPFANRRQPGGRGRKDIAPLTEQEVAKLGDLALAAHGSLYGHVVRGWILFLGWVGCRPGEAFQVIWDDVDLQDGRVTVQRVKGHKKTETIALPKPAADALLAMPGPRYGLLFKTVQGKRYDKGASAYYWRPVRSAFIAQLEESRRRELLAVKRALDVYSLRHFAGSLMADRGLTEFDIAFQLGHSAEVCRETYIHVHENRARDRIGMALNASPVTSLEAARERKMRESS